MKIGIDARFSAHGVGRYTGELLGHLAQIDKTNEYTVFVSAAPRYGESFDGDWGDNFTTVPVHAQIRSLSELWRFPSVIARYRLDLFHATSYPVPMFLRCPLVATVHDLSGKVDRSYLPPFRGAKRWLALRYYDLMNAYTMRHAQCILTVSNETKSEIVRFYPSADPADIVPIHLGVSRTFRAVDADTVERLRSRYDLPPKYMLFVGTVSPRKNLMGVIRAFEELARDPDWQHELVAVARHDDRYKEVYRAVESSPYRHRLRIIDYTKTEDMVGLYTGATALVFPSLHESFGLPVVEAFACGVPVITSNAAALPEIAGDAALLVDPYQVDQIADACRRVVRDDGLREGLIERGLDRARQFDWRITAEKTLAAYERVAG